MVPGNHEISFFAANILDGNGKSILVFIYFHGLRLFGRERCRATLLRDPGIFLFHVISCGILLEEIS